MDDPINLSAERNKREAPDGAIGSKMLAKIKAWFRAPCFLFWCPGELVNSKLVGGAVYWRCTRCGAHTQPK